MRGGGKRANSSVKHSQFISPPLLLHFHKGLSNGHSKKKKKVSNDEIMNAYYVLGTILNILCEIISFDPKKSYEVGSFIITQNK